MANTTIKIKDNGPCIVTGEFEVLDGDGNPLDTSGKPMVALCRCGQSANKPYCDGSHAGAGFESEVRAEPHSEETGDTPSEEE